MLEEMKKIGARIRELREINGKSREEVAQTLGISSELYENYEQSGADIPISVLYQLSHLFGVDFTEILTGLSPKLDTYCVVRREKGVSIDRYPGYHFESLAHKFMHKVMEPLMVRVEPDNQQHALVTHKGQEFNYVVEGSIMVEFSDEKVALNAGDSIYFDPNIPHGQRALGGTAAKFLTVIVE